MRLATIPAADNASDTGVILTTINAERVVWFCDHPEQPGVCLLTMDGPVGVLNVRMTARDLTLALLAAAG